MIKDRRNIASRIKESLEDLQEKVTRNTGPITIFFFIDPPRNNTFVLFEENDPKIFKNRGAAEEFARFQFEEKGTEVLRVLRDLFGQESHFDIEASRYEWKFVSPEQFEEAVLNYRNS